MPTRRLQPLLRSESFFGLHFDFHAKPDNEAIGGRPFAKDLARLLREVKPDYVQCDCKGHPGVASYPTEVGTPAPVFEGDALRVWRQETAKARVALFVHYSGVWDTSALAKHPEWALVNSQGQHDPNITSVFGPYWRDLLVHLVNTAGVHADIAVATHDQIPPLHDVAIRLRLEKKPSAIVWQLAGKGLPFRWSKGVAALRLPTVEIHEILQVVL